ncbi:MAG: CDP-glycerol glycerophosphotransferase family protein [Lachnospiraceae bacterium]|nr:CDP-glycerol glycerophosphotransferase family protein [Lachnospiraceae bacterium]
MFKVRYPWVYRIEARKKINADKVVFIEGRMKYITNSSEYIYNELSNYNFDIRIHFLQMGFVKQKEYRRLCENMIRDVATAKYVFMNDASNVFACLPLRKETVVTQLWHACGAFKKFGLSTADLIFGDDRKTQEKYPYHRNYTYVTVSSPEVEWAYSEAMNLKKGVAVGIGCSRTDFFYDENNIRLAREKMNKIFPDRNGRKIILYAPTFRGRVSKAKMPDKLDIEGFYEAFKDEYILVFKHHPFVKKKVKIEDKYKDFAIDCTDIMSIDDLLCVSDICISDYSSLVFEYSLFEKPMIFYAYDLNEYYDWRGFYYDYKDFVPGPICMTNEEMIEYIRDIDRTFDRRKVMDFKNKFMSACDGHATEKIMKLVFKDNLDKYKK